MSSSSTSAVSQSNTRYVYPFTCIMHNLPIKLDKDGKGSSKSYTWMRDMLRRHGYTNIKKVHTSWSQDRGFLGYAMIEFEGFGKKQDSFRQARKLHHRYEFREAGKYNFNTDDGLQAQYLWIATDRDIGLLRGYRYDLITVPCSWEAEPVPPYNPHIEFPIITAIAGELVEEYNYDRD